MIAQMHIRRISAAHYECIEKRAAADSAVARARGGIHHLQANDEGWGLGNYEKRQSEGWDD